MYLVPLSIYQSIALSISISSSRSNLSCAGGARCPSICVCVFRSVSPSTLYSLSSCGSSAAAAAAVSLWPSRVVDDVDVDVDVAESPALLASASVGAGVVVVASLGSGAAASLAVDVEPLGTAPSIEVSASSTTRVSSTSTDPFLELALIVSSTMRYAPGSMVHVYDNKTTRSISSASS